MRSRPGRDASACSVLSAALVLLLSAGCTQSGDHTSTPRGSASAPAPRPAPTVKDGHLSFTALFLQCGLTAVSGTHSEGTPEGQFCRARLRVANNDPQEHTYLASRQLVAGVDHAHSRPSAFAMAVRRQLPSVPIGAHDLIEVEVWYDVPKNARVTGLRVGGDRDATGFLDPSPIPYAPGGAFLPATPAPLSPARLGSARALPPASEGSADPVVTR